MIRYRRIVIFALAVVFTIASSTLDPTIATVRSAMAAILPDNTPCVVESAITDHETTPDGELHYYIDLKIPPSSGTVIIPEGQTGNRIKGMVYSNQDWLPQDIVDDWFVHKPGSDAFPPEKKVPENTWRVFVENRYLYHLARIIHEPYASKIKAVYESEHPEQLIQLRCNKPPAAAPPPQQPAMSSLQLFSGFDGPSMPVCFGDSYTLAWNGKPITLTGHSNVSSPFAVDDVLELTVHHPDGSQAGPIRYESMTHDMGPYDVSQYFEPGLNGIEVRILDVMLPNCGGGQVYLIWEGGLTPPSEAPYPILRNMAILAPQPGSQHRYAFEIPSWMHVVTGTLVMGSDATITFVGPDGSSYGPGHPSVQYTVGGRYAVAVLSEPPAGDWEIIVDVTQADPDSIFYLSVNGAQGDIPETDNIAPFSEIHVQGTSGLAGWYVSDVGVTITAEDVGGSGLQGIEFSLDSGQTWQPYTGPFTVAQEGLTFVTARATDHAGNVELMPPSVLLFIDKTPPVVNVWTDSPTYTRVDPFVVHVEISDPQPGSGICPQAADLDGTPVENEQSIDMLFFHLGTHTVTATGTDCAGWTTTNSASYELIATLESLKAGLTRFCTEGHITHQGLCNSLQQKLDAALAARDRGNIKAATNILQAFKAEVTAQTGKKIPSNVAELLHEDADYIINVLNSAP